MRFTKGIGLLVLIPLLLAACAGQPGAGNPTPTTEKMMTSPTGEMMHETPGAMMGTATPGEMMNETPGAMMTTPTGEMMGTAMPGEMMGTATPGEMMATGTPGAMMEPGTPGAMMEMGTPEAMMANGTPGATVEPAAWYAASLTDVSSGKTFSINDAKGKVILVEMMATWCPTCLSQETQLQTALKNLGSQDHLMVVGLDIDPNEDTSLLKAYVQKQGFGWSFAVAPKEVSSEIGRLYGDQFLNPPSTPMLIIDQHGVAHPLPFGLKDASTLQKALQPYLAM